MDYSPLINSFKSTTMLQNHSLAAYTSFGVGGCGDVVVFPKTIQELSGVIEFVRDKYPYSVIGNGTNVLISDKGFRGVCIITNKLSQIILKGNILEAFSGTQVSKIIQTAALNNLGGIEFAVGIPGTIGGLVAMNGGCFNKTISELVAYVRADDGVYNNKMCNFNYRTSRFLDGPIILSVGLKLKISEEDIIEEKLQRFQSVRQKNQPKGKSAGSIFLNQGYFAGKIIDKEGLKGYRYKGAFVSSKHANFIINEGTSANDIYILIQQIKQKVFSSQGIQLSEEIRYIGEF